MTTFIIILIAAGLTIFVLRMTGKLKFGSSDKTRGADATINQVDISSKYSRRSSTGLTVNWDRPIPDELIREAERGFIERRRSAIDSGYTKALSPYFYDIYLAVKPCIPAPQSGTLGMQIDGGTEYDGTEFDLHNTAGSYDTPIVKNGKTLHFREDGVSVILAAEMVLSLGTEGSRTVGRGQMVVCPDIDTIAEAVANGFDHIAIAHNNPAYHASTWYHGGGVYHPLLPERIIKTLRGVFTGRSAGTGKGGGKTPICPIK